MINVHCDKKGIKMIVAGDIPEIGTDLTHILNGICKKLDKQNPEIGLRFKLSFMMAFNSGLLFDTDSKGMKKLYNMLYDYLDSKDDEDEEDEDEEEDESDPVDDIDALLDKLIEVRNELNETRVMLEKQMKEAKEGKGKHEAK